MLDPKAPDPPPLDIFKGAAQTAPEVSGKLLSKVDTDAAPPAQSPQKASPESPKEPVGQSDDPLADAETERAVTDIAAKEGDTLLALQDAIGNKATRAAGQLAEQDRQAARRRRWAWLIFLVVFGALVLLALPLNTYTCHWPVGVRLRVTTDILPSVCK